jgi:anti-anti-sigma factor
MLASHGEVAPVPAGEYPFEVFGGVPVLRAPAEIDFTTSGELRAILLQWHGRGHATAVVDLTATMFCDLAGLRELMRAHQQAVAAGGGLRLVTPPDGALARIFGIAGLDGVIPHFATVKQALAQLPAAAGPQGDRGRGPTAAPASPPAYVRERAGMVAGSRRCEQCGAAFVLAREHARFCTSDCRAAWNREHLGDPAVAASALTWSIAAMSDATARLPAIRVWDKTQALAAIGEAVWWITMVDAALVRHHSGAYVTVLAAHAPAQRPVINETLAGLRFARNWIGRQAGLDDIIETGADTRRITRWKWSPVSESALAWLPLRAQAWERTRWLAYQACLAGHPIGKTISRAATFLTLTGADAGAGT